MTHPHSHPNAGAVCRGGRSYLKLDVPASVFHFSLTCDPLSRQPAVHGGSRLLAVDFVL